MQYPIIDLITSAYINNGWTGLDISIGKNLIDDVLFRTYSNWDTNLISYGQFPTSVGNRGYLLNGLIPGVTYTLSFGISSDSFPTFLYLCMADGVSSSVLSAFSYGSGQYIRNFFTFTASNNIYYIRLGASSTEINFNNQINKMEYVQLEQGSEATPYEPYSPSKNDFPDRLKLPLPHYFPHPVIDSLKRASEGTMTNKDREILTHYLTPLGIGGI